MYIEWSYLIYLAISFVVTVWVARTLYRNGRIFLVDAFGGNVELAGSINHLLVVGFYLINLGYVAQALTTDRSVDSLRGAIELVSTKIGTILLVLGAMHFFNVYVFNRFRRHGQSQQRPPVAPDKHISLGLEGQKS